MPSISAVARATTAAVAAFNGTLPQGYTYHGYEYLGCANEVDGHALQSGYLGGPKNMTIETCFQYCATKYMPLAGLEYGQDCYCGKALLGGSKIGDPSSCNTPCPGNSKETCGGSLHLSVFNNTMINGPKPPSKVGGTWSFDTCYMELQKDHVLAGPTWIKDSMTLEMCTSYCSTNGNYAYAGVENGNQCFCSNKVTPGAKDAYDLDCEMTCDIPCPGNNAQVCGGNSVITVYKNTG